MATESGFISGKDLSARFHDEVVRPLLAETPYAAGLLGWGSDVLGYDTVRSTDHGWGPRLHVFVDPDQVGRVREVIDKNLPDEFGRYPVRFGSDIQEPIHHITVTTVEDWLHEHLGSRSADLSTTDWLITPQQKLLGVVAGSVYADDGRLQPIRDTLSWYPDDLWIWMLACQWSRIGEEEAFVQRTAEVGDELGSRVVAARLTRDLMRLTLLMARVYAPYTKWLGTAFARLGHPDGLDDDLARTLTADDFAEREGALVAAYGKAARRQNALGITASLDSEPRGYHDRPALVLDAGRFATALLAKVRDPLLRELGPIGAIDQFADNTEVLSKPTVYRKLVGIYEK